LSIIRLIIENEHRVLLSDIFESAWKAGKYKGDMATVFDDLLSFFADRLKVHLKEEGVRHDLIAAILSLELEDDFVRLLSRVGALTTFISSEDGANLLTAYKRAANILRIEEKKDKTSYDAAADAGALDQAEEKQLHKVLTSVIGEISQNLEAEDYAKAMSKLASLRAPVDAFFDKVTVNCDDKELRVNRLRLLSQIRTTMNQVADFSKIEGGER
jgi:glycyl-tRNA synthetase beta chain